MPDHHGGTDNPVYHRDHNHRHPDQPARDADPADRLVLWHYRGGGGSGQAAGFGIQARMGAASIRSCGSVPAHDRHEFG